MISLVTLQRQLRDTCPQRQAGTQDTLCISHLQALISLCNFLSECPGLETSFLPCHLSEVMDVTPQQVMLCSKGRCHSLSGRLDDSFFTDGGAFLLELSGASMFYILVWMLVAQLPT